MTASDGIWLLVPLLCAAAFLYASVGHGGASAYIALLILCGLSPDLVRPSALIMNVLVSSLAFLLYFRSGFFRPVLFLPFALTSVPASFLGATLTLNADTYRIVLGLLLLFPLCRLLGFFGKENPEKREISFPLALFAGAITGLLSGMTGIGGGILLGPLILIMRWGAIKEAAAASALFIAVNSVAGLGGLAVTGKDIIGLPFEWVAAVLTGGLAGAYFGSARFSVPGLKALLAAVLLMASVKLIMTGSAGETVVTELKTI